MSTIVGDIIRAILGKRPKGTTENIKKAMRVATNLREWLKSPTISVLVAIIPGEWDNELRRQAIAALDKIIPTLYIGAKCGTNIHCWAEELSKLPKQTQDMNNIKLAQLLTNEIDGSKVRQSLYDHWVQEDVTKLKLAA